MSDERFAKPGTIWVCAACGKSHKDQYGIEGKGSYGWDESCALYAVLCHEQKAPAGHWVAVESDHQP